MSQSAFRSCWVQITAKRLAVIFRAEMGKLVGHIWSGVRLGDTTGYSIRSRDGEEETVFQAAQ